jgi:hypothetical protein
MKKTITVIIALLISISIFAQQGINYKAILKDTNGNVLAGTSLTVQFTIHKTTATGTIVYQEDHNYTTDASGLLILNIGTDTSPSVGVFADIDWSGGLHFLQTTITYGDTTINFDATKFMAVPYALHAANVSGLEKINQLGGPSHIKGWRLLGANPDNYVPIGYEAVDLSFAGGNPAATGALGSNSIAMGVNTKAFGYTSMAVGYYSDASGDHSTALGNRTLASGINSTAMGNNTIASGNSSLAVGGFNIDVPGANFIVGNGATLNNRNNALVVFQNGSIIAPSSQAGLITEDKALITKEYADIYLGGSGLEKITQNNISGWRLVEADPTNYGSIGTKAVDLSYSNIDSSTNGAIGAYSAAMGFNTEASGLFSTAFGNNTIASTSSSIAFGSYNSDDSNAVLMVGNGNTTSRNNAFTVKRNGNIELDGRIKFGLAAYMDVGSLSNFDVMINGSVRSTVDGLDNLGSPSFRYNTVYATNGTIQTSDRRDKTKISNLKYGLAEVMQLKPVNFNWKSNPNQDTKLGLIAQDLLQIIPEVVKTHESVSINKNDRTKSKRVEADRMGVYYSDLIPVLIKAIQEQQAIIEAQNSKLKNQNTKLDTFQNRLSALSKSVENLKAINN